jgi:HSP20 family protein
MATIPVAKNVPTDAPRREHTRSGPVFRPSVDIVERPDGLVLYADMPGCRSEQIDVRFEAGELTIHGTVAPRMPDGAHWLVHEYDVGDFHRTFEVRETIDASRITAEYRDGVLKVHLPKSEPLKSRKIQVQTST